MFWEVAYYHGQLPLVTRTSDDSVWDNLPRDGVVWVTLTHNGLTHQMRGYDYYWIDGDRFGCFNDSESRFGHPYAGQHWECDWKRVYYDRPAPDGVHILVGVMLPDQVAREVGLIGAD